jgi:hypothetical protein
MAVVTFASFTWFAGSAGIFSWEPSRTILNFLWTYFR